MKIYEIIAESKQVDEGIVSNVVNWATKSNALKTAIPDIAEKWAETLIKRSRTPGTSLELNLATVKKLAPPGAKRYLTDPAIVKEIEKQAAKIVRQKKFSTVKSALGMSPGPISKWSLAKTLGSAVYKIYATWQVAGMFSDYNSNVNAWDAELRKQLADGKITQEQYDAQLAHIRKTEMGLLITKVGAGLLGSAIARGTIAPVAFLFNKIPFTAPLGAMMTGLGRAGAAYVYSQLNSKEGSEMVAKIMVGNALGDTVTSTLGNVGTGALDWLTGTVKKGQELDQAPQTGTPTAGAPQGASTTPVAKPTATTTAPAVAAATAPVMPGDNKTATSQLDTPAGYTRDAAGNLILK